MKKHWLGLIGLVLLGCTTTHIKFDEDPQIFRGVWKGTAYNILVQDSPILSPDKSLIAVSSQTKGLTVLDSSSGAIVKQIPEDKYSTRAFTADNKYLIEVAYYPASGQVLQFLDTTSWKVQRTTPVRNSHLTISQDSNWGLDTDFYDSNLKRVYLLDLSGNKPAKTLEVTPAGIRTLSPHGKYVGVVSFHNNIADVFNQVDIWSTQSGSSISFRAPTNTGGEACVGSGLSGLFFSDDESKAGAVLNGKRILVWDIDSKQQLLDLPTTTCGSALVPTLSNDGSGSFVIPGGDSSEVFWDAKGKISVKNISSLVGSGQLQALLAGSAYLTQTSTLPYETKLSRVGTSSWQYVFSSKIADLSFDMQATKTDSSNYKATGQALMNGKEFSVNATSYGSITFTSVHAQTPPAMLIIDANLESTTGEKYHLYVMKGSESLLPGSKVRYDGYLDFTIAQPPSSLNLILER